MSAVGCFSQFNLTLQILHFSLDLWKKRWRRHKHGATVARSRSCWTIKFGMLEAEAIRETNGIKIGPNLCQIQSVLSRHCFWINSFWLSTRLKANCSLSHCLFPFFVHGRVKEFGVHKRYSIVDQFNCFGVTKGM